MRIQYVDQDPVNYFHLLKDIRRQGERKKWSTEHLPSISSLKTTVNYLMKL